MSHQIKLPKKYRSQFAKAGSRGGRNGSKADKIRAALASAEARAVRIRFKGESLRVAEWSERLGIPRATIWARLRAHLPVERVLKTKTNSQPTKRKTPTP
jgi:transcriptional regulator of acetoin/glycerol metabolism